VRRTLYGTALDPALAASRPGFYRAPVGPPPPYHPPARNPAQRGRAAPARKLTGPRRAAGPSQAPKAGRAPPSPAPCFHRRAAQRTTCAAASGPPPAGARSSLGTSGVPGSGGTGPGGGAGKANEMAANGLGQGNWPSKVACASRAGTPARQRRQVW